MDNNFNRGGQFVNGNSQFGGWGQQGFGYGQNMPNGWAPPGGPFIDPLRKKNDKKILRSAGNLFGMAIILYIIIATVISFAIVVLSDHFPLLNELYSDDILSSCYDIIASILFLGGPFFLAYSILKKKKIMGILPFGTPYNKKAAIYFVMFMLPVVLLSSMGINIISFYVQEYLGITFTSGMEDMQVTGVFGTIVSVISMAIVPALIEETAIRGIVMQPLRRYGDTFAIISSAVIFSILHGNMVQIPYTMVAGIYFGLVAVLTGSLWPSIVLHCLNNLFSVVIMATEGNFGIDAANNVTYAMLGFVVVLGIFSVIKFGKSGYEHPLTKGVNTLKSGEKVSALFINPTMIIAIVIMLILTATSISSNAS
ncbi:MAG: CPBP family intramembrane metalloprotease [Oscillospiraceae bacterium]|nr:CPBP family intramembrane metalloprotease [Oscillospiraceae bacterium]